MCACFVHVGCRRMHGMQLRNLYVVCSMQVYLVCGGISIVSLGNSAANCEAW